MIKNTIFTIVLSLALSNVFAQYIEYKPNPVVAAPPIEVPQMQIALPQRYLPPYPTENKPTISILFKFLILSAKVNGQDYSQHYINASAGVAIYSVSNQNTKFMTVVVPGDNSNSNGKMFAVTEKEVPQSSSQYGKTITTFAWDFVNSSDGKTGSATVTMTKEYRTDGTFVKCHIQATNGTICDFDGTMAQ